MKVTDDIEKQTRLGQTQVESDSVESAVQGDGVSRDGHGEKRIDAIRESNAILRFFSNLNNGIGKLAAFEVRGVERVPEDKRRPPQKLNVSCSFAFPSSQNSSLREVQSDDLGRWSFYGFHCSSARHLFLLEC